MTVATSPGGTTVMGVVVGAAGSPETPREILASATGNLTALPFTGSSDLVLLLAIGLLIILAGLLVLGAARRHDQVGTNLPLSGDA